MDYEYSKDKVFTETIQAPDFVVFEDEAECSVYIDSDNSVKDLDNEYFFDFTESVAGTVGDIQKSLQQKSFEGSEQTKKELNKENTQSIDALKIVSTPYEPSQLARFLEINEIHFRAMETRVSDSVGREYKIKAKYPIEQDDVDLEDSHGNTVTQEEFEVDCKAILDFIENSNNVKDFEQTTSLVAMDRIAIGWSGFEVIRSANGQIAKLNHIPAVRLRVIEGWDGFAEERGIDPISNKSRYAYYQPFGQKVGKMIPDPFDPNKTVFSPYDPDRDGELDIAASGLVWNFRDKETGKIIKTTDEDDPKRLAKNFEQSANEVLYLPNDHINTIYYGYADVIPAIGAILANVYIRDYLLQFLGRGTVPRYAVIIKGARVDDKFKKYITDYFNKLKGNAYDTMIITLSGLGNKNIDITFEKISTDMKEMDFMKTKKENDQVIITADAVSAAVLGINETASLGSGKGLSQAEMYKNRVVVPSQLFWERKLNHLFKYGLGVLNAVIKYDPLDVKDLLDVAQSLNLMLLNGVITINEARRELGFAGPIKGGDFAYVRAREGSIIKVEDLPNIEAQLTQGSVPTDNDGNALDVDLDLQEDGEIRKLKAEIAELQAAVNNLNNS